MSWLARSIANSLKLDDDDGDDVSTAKLESKQLENPENHLLRRDDDSSPTSPSRGVKNDLSDLTKSLTRQLWGVASFLAPPPQQPRHDPETEDSDLDVISGIRSDFAEIGGKFKSGISRLSNNINVSEITKMASDFLQLGSDDEGDEEGNREDFDTLRKGAVGVTEEVVAFSRDIAMHPETWLDFPLPENAGDDVDFDMSDAQQEHASAVERLAPRLASLRIELCPGYMSESCFWKIYFVLLHPRLYSHDAELLSTPQIVKARALLAQELKNQTPTKLENVSDKRSFDPKDDAGSHNEEPLSVPSPVLSSSENNKASDLEIHSSPALVASETVKHSIESNEIQIVDKPVIGGKDVDQVKDQILKSGFSNVLGEKDEDEADDWLKEESSEIGATSGVTIPIENEDDVSFSDLEEDDREVPATFKKSNYSFDKDSPDWVQLGKSSSDSSKDIDIKHSDNESLNAHDTKESNDWLDVDDIDVA